MKRRVTQQDIARKLGLDKSTVSLGLRNHPSIPLTTRTVVKAMAEKLGYRPDPALATLARQRWAGHETGSGATLAYVMDSRMQNFESHRRFLTSCRARADQRGYRLYELDFANYPTLEAATRVLHHRGIRGVLVPQLAHTVGPGILDLPSTNFTVMCLDFGWDPVPFHVVATDTFQETRLVWREVTSRGFERVGGAILAHKPRALDDAARFGASCASQREWLPARHQIPLLTTDPWDRRSFVKWMKRWQPDVVIGFIPRVYDWLCEEGWRVPEDVSFAALTLVISERPAVTGCVSQGDQIGSNGVDALIAAMSENEWGVPLQQRKLLLQPIWNEGRTLAGGGGTRG
jgi:DNA-binding LacI/PurR family transcriptional regulator